MGSRDDEGISVRDVPLGESPCGELPEAALRGRRDTAAVSSATNRLAVGLGELAQLVGVDAKTLRVWARRRGLPTYRIGGRVFVITEEFLAWLRAHRETSALNADAELATLLTRISRGKERRSVR